MSPFRKLIILGYFSCILEILGLFGPRIGTSLDTYTVPFVYSTESRLGVIAHRSLHLPICLGIQLISVIPESMLSYVGFRAEAVKGIPCHVSDPALHSNYNFRHFGVMRHFVSPCPAMSGCTDRRTFWSDST